MGSIPSVAGWSRPSWPATPAPWTPASWRCWEADPRPTTPLGGPINADIARRIAFDAQIIPIVLGARGEPLDVGRASHTVPTAIRRAVIVRDGGCAFSGCAVPARWCEIHHVVHWADHGPTSVDNCAALCGRHHRLVHHSDWRIDMATVFQNSIHQRGWAAQQSPPHRARADPNPPVAAVVARAGRGSGYQVPGLTHVVPSGARQTSS